jgi:hypothetical protein
MTQEPPHLAKPSGWWRRPHVVLCLFAAAVVVVSSALGSGGNWRMLPFLLWALLPWAVLLVLGRLFKNEWPPSGAALAGLVVETGIRSAVFLFPQGSTAAIAQIFSPAYVLLIALPVGALLGWLAGKVWAWHFAGRLMVALAIPPLLYLGWLGLARPERFPIAVARREALLERIGPPRVAVGARTFARDTVTSKNAWPHVAELDGSPGQELALARHDRAIFLDPSTLQQAGEADYSTLSPATWNWYSRLVRLGDRLAIAQTGGGFSDTKVLSLDGTALWEYRPNPNLAPDALRPADLDGDGATEFYASSTDGVARLDAAGREVWRQPTRHASLVALAARGNSAPGWVLAVEYGRRFLVWDETGRLLADTPANAEEAPMGIVDHAVGHALVRGGPSARGYDLAGRELFKIALPDMKLSAITSFRTAPDATPRLALVAVAERHAKRWRALVVAADGTIEYDEISGDSLSWLVARKADGADELFLSRPKLLERLRPSAR